MRIHTSSLIALVAGACTAPGELELELAEAHAAISYPEWSIAAQEQAAAAREQRRAAARIPNLRAQRPPADWIYTGYHGSVYDANLDEIVLDAATIAAIQQSTFDAIYAGARSAAIARYGQDLRGLFDSPLQGLERMIARQAALWGLIEVSQDQYYERSITLLRGGVTAMIEVQGYQMSPGLGDLIDRFHVSGWWRPEPGADYLESCRQAGVPRPPDWPSDAWVDQGQVAFPFILKAGYESRAQSFRSSTTAGVCMALPRWQSETRSIDFLGIICMSETTGKACFWDNRSRNDVKLTGPALELDIGEIGDGRTLVENCLDCHRGKNPFIIHPGSALDLTRTTVRLPPWDTDPAVRFTPIGQPTWINPPPLVLPPPPAGQLACNGCHEIPGTRSAGRPIFCETILESAAFATMPPVVPPTGTVAGWPRFPRGIQNPKYAAHITALAACP